MNWTLIAGVFLGVLTLRVVGFISSTWLWLVLGFTVFAWLWGYVSQQIPGQAGQPNRPRQVFNWAMGLILTLALLATIGVNLYESIPAITKQALTRRYIATHLDTATRLNPEMLRSRTALAEQIQNIQDQIGERHQARLANIQYWLKSSQVTPDWAITETNKVLAAEQKYRCETKKMVADLTKSPSSPAEKDANDGWAFFKKIPPTLKNIFMALAVVGAIIIAVRVIIPRLPQSVGRLGIWMFAVGLVGLVVMAAVFGGDNTTATAASSARSVFVGQVQPGEKLIISRGSADTPTAVRVSYARAANEIFQGRRLDWPGDELTFRHAGSQSWRGTAKVYLLLRPGQSCADFSARKIGT